MVSNTGWTSLGELEITRSTSEVAACCSRASEKCPREAGGAHDSGDGGAVRPAQQCKHPRLFRIRSRMAMAGDPAASYLRADFGGRRHLCDSRTLALGHAKTPLNRVGARSRRHHLNPPRRPKGAGGGEEQAVRLAGREHHTRSLGGKSPAQSAQWGYSIGRRQIISGSAEIMSAMRLDDRAPARETRLRSGTRPELRLPAPAAQTRIVSMARIRVYPRKSVRPFKGIFCADVSEFESHMPSHAVGLSASLLVSAGGAFRRAV
jgi:hypothetical protein